MQVADRRLSTVASSASEEVNYTAFRTFLLPPNTPPYPTPPVFMPQPITFKMPANQRRAGSSSAWRLFWREAHVLLFVFLEIFGRLEQSCPPLALCIHHQKNNDIVNERSELLTSPNHLYLCLIYAFFFKLPVSLFFCFFFEWGHFLLFKINSEADHLVVVVFFLFCPEENMFYTLYASVVVVSTEHTGHQFQRTK